MEDLGGGGGRHWADGGASWAPLRAPRKEQSKYAAVKGNPVAPRKDDGQFAWLNPGSSILLRSWRLLSEGVSCLTGPAHLSSFPSPRCPKELTAPHQRPGLCALALGQHWEEVGGNARNRLDGTYRSQDEFVWVLTYQLVPGVCACVPGGKQ